MFFHEHEVDPVFPAFRQGIDGLFQDMPFQALVDQDLADLFSFTIRYKVYVAVFHFPDAVHIVHFRFCRAVVSRCHGKSVCQDVCRTKDHDDGAGKVGPFDAGNDCEGRYRSINAAINKIAEMADFCGCRKAFFYLFNGVSVFHAWCSGFLQEIPQIECGEFEPNQSNRLLRSYKIGVIMAGFFLNNTISVNAVIFAVLALTIWFSGSRLTYIADAMADRFGLSRSMVGLVFLSTATSLPEIATTLVSAAEHLPGLAVNNLFGGIALQTVILAVADLWTKGAISNYPRKANHALEATLLVSLLSLCAIVFVIDEPWAILHVGTGSVAVFVVYILSIALLRRYDESSDWVPVDLPETLVPTLAPADQTRTGALSNTKLLAAGIGMIAVILLAGVAIVNVSNVLSEQSGIGNNLMGVIFLAGATSLPELTTTITAVRLGAYTLAISNIFGSNLIMLVLVFPADILFTEGPILRGAGATVELAVALGILVTSIYLIGLIIRRKPRIGRMGIDSAVVALVYVVGLFLYWALPD